MTFGVGSIQFSFRTIVFTQYIFNPNVNAFQSNCAEGLYFSAFHSVCVSVCVFPILAPRAIRRSNSSIRESRDL